jgi:hypothetical protein
LPDLKGFAAANGHIGKTDDDVRAELGEKSRREEWRALRGGSSSGARSSDPEHGRRGAAGERWTS